MNKDHAQQLAGIEHGDYKHGPRRVRGKPVGSVGQFGIALGVVNVESASLKSGSSHSAVPSRSDRVALDESLRSADTLCVATTRRS